MTLAGTLSMRPAAERTGAPLLDGGRRHPVRARVSWGVGPLRGLPDVAGFGLRVLDADGRGGGQDLLVDSSLPAPRDRVLVLRRDLAGWYGSPLRLRLRLGTADGPKVQIAVRLHGCGIGLAEVAAADRLTGHLLVHRRGRLLAAGRLELTPEAGAADPGRLRFDLGADAGGLVTAGFWAGMRARAYADSRAGDPRPATTRTAAAATGRGR